MNANESSGSLWEMESTKIADPPAEESLVEKARQDPEAFAELYRRYYSGVFRYCVHRLLDRTAAEDVTAASLTHLEGTEPFDYADNPLWREIKQQETPSQAQLFQRMVERLQLATGAELEAAPTSQAATAAAWQKWWSEHAVDYGVTAASN